jgi:hypothetical protein
LEKGIIMNAPPIDFFHRILESSSLEMNEVVFESGLPREAAIFGLLDDPTPTQVGLLGAWVQRITDEKNRALLKLADVQSLQKISCRGTALKYRPNSKPLEGRFQRLSPVVPSQASAPFEALAYEVTPGLRLLFDRNILQAVIHSGAAVTIASSSGNALLALTRCLNEPSNVFFDSTPVLTSGTVTDVSSASFRTEQLPKTESASDQTSGALSPVSVQGIIGSPVLGLSAAITYLLRQWCSENVRLSEVPAYLPQQLQGRRFPIEITDPISQQQSDSPSRRPKTKAEEILREAIERYRRPDGYEGYLVEAAWQLEQIGSDAWPALRELVMAGIHECEYFLGTVVRLQGVPPHDRLTVLLAAARNRDANVRSRLLELLDEIPLAMRRDVLGELTAVGSPDDTVADRLRHGELEQAS